MRILKSTRMGHSSRLAAKAAEMLMSMGNLDLMSGKKDEQRRPLCARRKRKGDDPRKIKRKMQKSSRKANR